MSQMDEVTGCLDCSDVVRVQSYKWLAIIDRSGSLLGGIGVSGRGRGWWSSMEGGQVGG
jgi:hypothetical protein